jgi:hypothetical protein
VNQYVRPIGEGVGENNVSMNPVCAPSTRMYLGVGDMVCVGAEQNFSTARSLGTALGGSMMSLRFVGLAVNDDRTLINTSIGSGGSVSLVSHGTLQQANFFNTHTYSYHGKNTSNGIVAYTRRNSDLNCYQGLDPSTPRAGSQTAQVAFKASNIISTLTGHTILSATVTATNVATIYAHSTLLLGWTSDTPGKATFNAQDHNTNSWVTTARFTQGQVLTFSIPISIVKAFINSGANALVLGNDTTTDKENYGVWQGGPGSWELTVNYV